MKNIEDEEEKKELKVVIKMKEIGILKIFVRNEKKIKIS